MSLTNITQIKGGTDLMTDIDSLKASYAANKVITTIENQSPETGYRNVDDVLKELLAGNTGAGSSSGSNCGNCVKNIDCTVDGIVVTFNDGTVRTVPLILPAGDDQFITPSEVEQMFVSEGDSTEVPAGDIMTETEALEYLEGSN